MSIIADFSVKSVDFALSQSLTAAPGTVVEVERVVAMLEDRVMPYFWVTRGDLSKFEDALYQDDSVDGVTVVDDVDDARLYRAEWTENVETIVYAYTEIGATILRAVGKNDRWELRMRFDDSEKLFDFRGYCDGHGIGFELLQLHEQKQPMASGQYDLTTKQRETLVAALEAGYYDVPQQVTMSELADELDVSQQALSKRFHDGHRNLIRSVLTVSDPDEEEFTSIAIQD
jgi:predicted DNA binding protein